MDPLYDRNVCQNTQFGVEKRLLDFNVLKHNLVC